MAALKPEVKAAIVQMLACYDTPSQVVEAVQKDFGIAITRQQVETHDPTKVSGKTLAKKWVDLFNLTRDRFLNEISDIPIANNKATADFLITSSYMNSEYEHRVINFQENIAKRAKSL